MKRRSILVLLISCCTVAVLVAAPARSLESLRAVWDRCLMEIKVSYAEKEARWPAEYLKNLNALRAKLQSTGNLENWVIVDKEYKRFSAEKKISKSDVADGPQELKGLRRKYMNISSELNGEKSEEIVGLANLYTRHLDSLKVELTKKGKMAEAMKVLEEIKTIKSCSEVTAANFVMAEREIQQEMAAVTKEIESDEPAKPQPTLAQTASTSDAQVKQWLALYVDAVKKNEEYLTGGRTPELKNRAKTAEKAWNAVADECCYAISKKVSPKDTTSLKKIKQEYVTAHERYWKARNAYTAGKLAGKKKHDGDFLEYDELKQAGGPKKRAQKQLLSALVLTQ